MFKKKCKTFAIDENNILVKLKKVTDDNGNRSIKSLKCVPPKYKDIIMHYFHYINKHCEYLRLMEIIKNNDFYWNNIAIDCKNFVKDCINEKIILISENVFKNFIIL